MRSRINCRLCQTAAYVGLVNAFFTRLIPFFFAGLCAGTSIAGAAGASYLWAGPEFPPSATPELAADAAGAVPVASFPGTVANSLAFRHTLEPGPAIEEWRAATALAHRQAWQLPDWPEVFAYEVEYTDDEVIRIPVRFGEGIRERLRTQTVGPMLWAPYHISDAAETATSERPVSYVMVAPNPRPDAPIRAIRATPSSSAWRNWGTVRLEGALVTDGLPGSIAPSGKLLIVERPVLGDDNNPGTWEKPLATLARAVELIQPGDTILVRGGNRSWNLPVEFRFDGAEGSWTTISSFPGESPVFDARAIQFDPRFVPYGETRAPAGVHQQDTGALSIYGDPDFFRVQGLHIHNSTRAGLSVHGEREGRDSAWSQTRGIDIRFNNIWQTYSMGIISHTTDNIRVQGNQVIRPHSIERVINPLTGEPASHDHQPQEGIDLSRNRHFEISFNVVAGGGKEAIDCISVEDGEIHHNYVHSCLNGIYIDSWSVPIRDLRIYRNFIHNAFAGIPLAAEGSSDLENFQIHQNIVIDSKMVGIAVTEATYKANPARVRNHHVHNNTVVASGYHAIGIGWQGAGIRVSGFPENENFRDVLVEANIVTDTRGMPLNNVYAGDAYGRNIHFRDNVIWPTSDDSTPEWLRANKSWNGAHLERGEATRILDPGFLDPLRGDFRPSPAIGSPAPGALDPEEPWSPGLDFAGTTTAYRHGTTIWHPLTIDRDRYNLHRNNLLRPSWFQRNRYGADFRNLPDGEQSFAGVTFFVERGGPNSGPNVLTLAGLGSEATEEAIIGLPVNRTAARIAFLHNAHISDRDALSDGSLFHYQIHYADGSSVSIPIRAGREINDWLVARPGAPRNARVGWEQLLIKRRGFQHLQLYTFVWDNPRPEVPVAAIDIIRDADPMVATPAIFAISTGN